MFRGKSTRICPEEPFLKKKGLVGRRLGVLGATLDYCQGEFLWLVNVNAVFISCKKTITADDAMKALHKLCLRHPNLRMRITLGASDSDRFLTAFETTPEPDLEVLDTDDWMAVSHAELNRSFSCANLQWRVKMLKPTESGDRWRQPFIFAFNHAVVDGGCIIAGILTDFFHHLDDAMGGRDTPVESMELLPSRDLMFPQIQVTFFDKLKFRFLSLLSGPPFGVDKVAGELVQGIRPQDDRERVASSKLLPIEIEEDLVKRIVSKCKEHEIKVNGFVSAAAAAATAKLVWENTNLPKNEALKFHTAFMVNIRRFADPPIPPDQVGLMSSIIPTEVSVADDGSSSDAFWELAKRCHDDVHAAIAEGGHMTAAHMVNTVFSAVHPRKFYKETSESEIPMYTYYMTNRGNFEIKPRNPEAETACTFEGNYWAAAEHRINVAVFVHSLQTVNGKMTWTLAYYGDRCTEEIARNHLKDIKNIMERMAE